MHAPYTSSQKLSKYVHLLFTLSVDLSDWSAKSCDLAMLVGSRRDFDYGQPPKLEDFLGGRSSSSSYLYSENYAMQIPAAVMPSAEESQSSSSLPFVAAAAAGVGGVGESILASENNNKGKADEKQLGGGGSTEMVAAKKSVETFGQRTSIYRGVTRFEI